MEFFNTFYLPLLLLTLLPFLFYYIQTRNKFKSNSGNKITLADLVKNGHRFLDYTTDQLRSSPTNTVTMPTAILTANPSNVEHIVKTKFDNYDKGESFASTLEDFLGRGIFNADGDHWKLQRKTASLEFNTKTIRTFVMDNVRREVVDRLLPRLSAAAAAGETLDLQDVLDRFAFDNVCKVAFDVDPARLAGDTEEGGNFARAFEPAADITIKRFQRPRFLWKISRFLNVGQERKLKKELNTVNEFALKIVRERKQRKEESGSDLLSRFIEEGDFSDEFLRDIVISFVLAGRDTTSSAMSWFFWLVSSKPAVQQKILEEIRTVRSSHGSSGGVVFTLDELREMDYLHAALSEALRLYPPVSLDVRTCKERDVWPDGTVVEKGASVMYNSYAMGRMEGIWGEDSREFRPERWLDSNGTFQAKSPYKFPVFHAGPRMCLGKDMAYIQMKAVVASVMERFVIEVVDKGEREHELTLVLRMKGGLMVRVKAR